MRSLLSVIFVAAFVGVASAQESVTRLVDSTSLSNLVFHRGENFRWQASFLLTPNISDTTLIRDYPAASLRNAIVSEPFGLDGSSGDKWSLRPLDARDELRSFRIAINYAQAGGSLYLAYRALKKQGFLK